MTTTAINYLACACERDDCWACNASEHVEYKVTTTNGQHKTFIWPPTTTITEPTGIIPPEVCPTCGTCPTCGKAKVKEHPITWIG